MQANQFSSESELVSQVHRAHLFRLARSRGFRCRAYMHIYIVHMLMDSVFAHLSVIVARASPCISVSKRSNVSHT